MRVDKQDLEKDCRTEHSNYANDSSTTKPSEAEGQHADTAATGMNTHQHLIRKHELILGSVRWKSQNCPAHYAAWCDTGSK